jgi:predicted dehydrogenase
VTSPSSGVEPIALVGYGSAGRGIHAPLLAAVGAPPAVVVTANPERIGQVEHDLPEAVTVPTLAQGLGRAPALVVLASPTGVHAEQVLQCVAAGVPVVVDKPLAVDAAQARPAVQAALGAGVPLTVFHNRRWDPENLTLSRLLAVGALGSVYRFERRWERWRPEPRQRWRENAPPAEGGGIVLDLQSHLVDSALDLFGPVDSVYAEITRRTTPADDEAFLALRHTCGVTSHLGASSVAGAPGPRTRVLAERGAYVVTQFPGEPVAFGGYENEPGSCGWLVTGETRQPVPVAPGSHEDFYRSVLAALAVPDPAQRQAAMPVDPASALAVLEVLDAARVSAREQRVVTITREPVDNSGSLSP